MCFESLVNLMMDKLELLDDRLRQQTSTLWEVRLRMEGLERRLGELDSKVDRQDRRLAELDANGGVRFEKLKEVRTLPGRAAPETETLE